MSEAPRPTISPALIASMIESTPERVRRRLDRAPDIASEWTWQWAEASWSIEAGDETVTLPHGQIIEAEQVACTCLLSPRCFHVLACLTRLEIALLEAPILADDASEPAAGQTSEDHASDVDLVELSENQRRAALELTASVSQLLRVGIAGSGVVVQSGLLRAIHRCRSEGLHRLAGLGLRLIAGTREIRSRAPEADPNQLAEDLADVLETSHHVLRDRSVPSFWVGTARRKQESVRPRRLLGLFAEPIITRSGYSGAAAYFLGEDGRIYTASDVRPGDAQHARDAYLGGIEIGPLVQSARQLARGQYLGTDLTASTDGRLGRGKGPRIVEQGTSSWTAEAIAARFHRPLADQWDSIYAQASLPEEARSAVWDFLFFEGTVLGAVGPELLFQPTADPLPLRLAIENESEALCFRENLRMLSHAPGLPLQIIGRAHPLEPRVIAPLGIAPLSAAPDLASGSGPPQLALPDSWAGRVCLGFDELQRHHLLNAQSSPITLPLALFERSLENPLAPLRRRWIATLLAGSSSRLAGRSKTLPLETATLSRSGFTTGASLLDLLSSNPSHQGSTPSDAFLATAVYLRACAFEQAKFQATLEG